MPRELRSREELAKMLGAATEIRVVRSEDSAKVKLRMKEGLYTFKTSAEEADAIVKDVKVPVVELGQKKK